MGSGRTSLAKSMFGLQPIVDGEIRLKEKVVKISTPPEAVEAGIAMIPEDRLTQGLVLSHSVAENMTLPVIDRLSRFGFVQEAEGEKAWSRVHQAIAGQDSIAPKGRPHTFGWQRTKSRFGKMAGDGSAPFDSG